MTVATCMHNAVPVKNWWRKKKWICIHCDEEWSIDPTSTHSLLHKVAEFADTMTELHHTLWDGVHGEYVIQEEP